MSHILDQLSQIRRPTVSPQLLTDQALANPGEQFGLDVIRQMLARQLASNPDPSLGMDIGDPGIGPSLGGALNFAAQAVPGPGTAQGIQDVFNSDLHPALRALSGAGAALDVVPGGALAKLVTSAPLAAGMTALVKGFRGGSGGFGATEGKGLYVAKDRGTAEFFGDVSTIEHAPLKNPLVVVDEPLPLLDEEFPIYSPIKDTDSEWVQLNKLAAQNAKAKGITPDNWDPDGVSDELTKLAKARGYDGIDVTSGSEGWLVLFDPIVKFPEGFTSRSLPDGRVEILSPDGTGMGFYAPPEVQEAVENLSEGFRRGRESFDAAVKKSAPQGGKSFNDKVRGR